MTSIIRQLLKQAVGKESGSATFGRKPVCEKPQAFEAENLTAASPESGTADRKNAVGKGTGYFVLSLWFALVMGLWELGFLYFRVFVQKQVIVGSINPHLPWLTVLAELLIFTPVGIVLFLATWAFPGLVSLRLATFALALPAIYALRSVFAETPWYAWAILNIGAAAAVSYLLASRPGRTRSLVRRSFLILISAWAVICLGTLTKGVLTERNAIGSLPTAAPDAPNVLFIVLDTVRAQSMSLYGFQRETTPCLTSWSKRGVCFDHAVAPAPWTLPSHAAFFTGHMPHEMFSDWNRMKFLAWELPMDNRFPTLAELFAGRGYRTAGFVANWGYGDRVFGLNRGFAHYEDLLVFHNRGISLEQVLNSSYLTRTSTKAIRARGWRSVLPEKEEPPDFSRRDPIQDLHRDDPLARKDASQVNGDFLGWLDANRDRPFFAFLNYMDTHNPYIHREEFAARLASKIPGSLPDPPATNEAMTKMAEMRLDFESSLAYLDDQIGKLLESLEARSLLESTLVIITADHGEQFGEHGRRGHGNTLYMQLLHVPLLVLYPGKVPAGTRVSEPVSLVDLPATILDVLHLPDAKSLPGKSLAKWWTATAGQRPQADPILSELDVEHPIFRMRSVVHDGYHYITIRYTGRQELYRWISDPYEERNLATAPEHKSRMERLAALIAK